MSHSLYSFLTLLTFFSFLSTTTPKPQNASIVCNPVIVGGIGGSGTRGVIAFLEEVGMKPPKIINKAHDIRILQSDESLMILSDLVMQETKSIWFESEELTPKTWKLFQEIYSEINTLCSPGVGVQWGFKAPNTMFLVPLWAHAFPEMCFVHVIRDGRDMAYSLRGRQAGVLFDSFFCGTPPVNMPEHLVKAQFWQRANLQLYEKASAYLQERYVPVKIEDLMDEPSRPRAGRSLLQNLGMGEVVRNRTRFEKALDVFSTNLGGTKGTEVNLDETYGKWKEQPIQEIRQLERLIIRSLRAFGYPLTKEGNS